MPRLPIASEKSCPPIRTSNPRDWTASRSASTVRRGTDDSTKIAGNPARGNEFGQRLDIMRPRLGRGAGALDTAHLEAVPLSKIAERVVRGDQHPPLLRYRRYLREDPFLELGQLRQVGIAICLVCLRPRRIEFLHSRNSRLARQRPETDIEPDVRIRVPLELRRRAQEVLRDLSRDRDRRLALAHLLEHEGEPALEVESVIEDDIAPLHRAQGALARLEEVRIDPRPHQRIDVDPVPADIQDQIADHPGRRHRIDDPLRDRPGFLVREGAAAEGKREGRNRREANELTASNAHERQTLNDRTQSSPVTV